MSKRYHQKVNNCDGWGWDRHPTERKVREITAFRGTDKEITLVLCPDCLNQYNRERDNIKAWSSNTDQGSDGPRS